MSKGWGGASNRGGNLLSKKQRKEWVYALCERVQRGDQEAERQLEEELSASAVARWAEKHWRKVRAGKERRLRKNQGGGHRGPRRSVPSMGVSGDPTRPVQGGAFGSGKTS